MLEQPKASRSVRLAILWTAYGAITLIAFAIYIRIAPSPDQSLFDYMAWLQLHGVPFYKGSFDMTWPGGLVLHELYILIFGVHSWTARAGDFLLLQPAIFAIFQFLNRAGFRRGGAAAALIYPIIYVTSGWWMAGHRDLVAAHFLVAAAIFALPSEKPWKWGPYFAGVLVGCATMIRPTYLAFGPMVFPIALSSWEGRLDRRAAWIRSGLIFGLGIVTAPLAFVLYGYVTGTLGSWYQDSFLFVLGVYRAHLPVTRLFGEAANAIVESIWWLTIAALFGAGLWFAANRSRRALLLMVALVATVFLSYFVQNKGFGYHLGGLIPAFVILACGGADAYFPFPVSSSPARTSTAALVGGLLIAGTGLRLVHAIPHAPNWGSGQQGRSLRPEDAIALSRIIRRESSPSDRLLQWGWEYRVSFLAQRLSATRFVNTEAARSVRPGQAIFGSWIGEFDRELHSHPPKFILIDETVIPPGEGLPAVLRPGDEPMLDVVKRRINAGYFIRDRRGSSTLLERTDPRGLMLYGYGVDTSAMQ